MVDCARVRRAGPDPFRGVDRETVSVSFWLLPGAAIEMPLYLVVLGTLIIGFLVGEVVAWVGNWRWRREARRSRERIAVLERELAAERVQRAEARVPIPVSR